MARVLAAVMAVAFLGVAVPAFAFTQEPVNVGGSGAAVADPNDQYTDRVAPSSATPQQQQPSSFSINGRTPPGPRLSAPVERQSPENDHLYWNNSSKYWR
ncbi:MAG: hypothetical protein JNM48_05940 [Rhodospirillales bacterium]|nr:hypothetical protein [Rhodospirillales bacterium]